MPLSKVVLDALRQAERDNGLVLLDGRPLVVGVSGGMDSLALLHALCRVVPARSILVAHLNHQLRPTAEEDAQAVAAVAARWGVQVRLGETNVAALADDAGLSLEEAGRKARYRFLAETARTAGAACVLVAHHADDQAETVLMHLLRGSGLAGLRGMPVAGPLPDAPDIWLVRPLLGVDRAAIEAYCHAHVLQPREDETNQDTTFFRNRLRHELLPLLATYSPQIKRHLQHLAAVIAADYELLDSVVEEAWLETVVGKGESWVQLDQASWQARPLGVRRRLLRRAVIHCRPDLRDIGFETVEQARLLAERGETGTQAVLPGGVELRVNYGRLTVTADPAWIPLDVPQLDSDKPIELAVPGRVALNNRWVLAAEWVASPELQGIQQNADPWQAFIALPEGASLIVRRRVAGERFQPLGMEGRSAAVKEVMVNRKVPAAARGRWPMVATQHHLAWVVGHVVDGRVRVTDTSQRVVRLQCFLESS